MNIFFFKLSKIAAQKKVFSLPFFTFEVPFNGLFAPTSRSRMSNIFRDSESLGKSNGKKWSNIWIFLFWSGLKLPRKFFFFLLILPWSTLLWHRCYYPYRSRDALSPVCGIFLYIYIFLQQKDTWPMPPDTGNLTLDTWNVTHKMCWKLSKNFRSLALWVLERQSFENIVTKDDSLTQPSAPCRERMSEWLNEWLSESVSEPGFLPLPQYTPVAQLLPLHRSQSLTSGSCSCHQSLGFPRMMVKYSWWRMSLGMVFIDPNFRHSIFDPWSCPGTLWIGDKVLMSTFLHPPHFWDIQHWHFFSLCIGFSWPVLILKPGWELQYMFGS